MAYDKWSRDQKVGAMTRGIMQDVRGGFYNFKARLYESDYQGDDDYMHSALEFSNFIGTHFHTESLKHTLQLMIEKAIRDKKDLWRNPMWLLYIRNYADIEFEKKVGGINSAIAVLASLDGTKKKKVVEDDWWED